MTESNKSREGHLIIQLHNLVQHIGNVEELKKSIITTLHKKGDLIRQQYLLQHSSSAPISTDHKIEGVAPRSKESTTQYFLSLEQGQCKKR